MHSILGGKRSIGIMPEIKTIAGLEISGSDVAGPNLLVCRVVCIPWQLLYCPSDVIVICHLPQLIMNKPFA